MGTLDKPEERRVSHESHLEKAAHGHDHHTMTGFDTNIESLPPGYFTSTFFIGTMLAAALGLLAGVAGFGYAAPVLAVINADIGPDPNLAWVGLVYTLMLAVFLTLVGRVSDVFGRRWVFAGGSCLGVIGSIICAVAKDIPTLIGGTTVIGTYG
jgi:MFS family permease